MARWPEGDGCGMSGHVNPRYVLAEVLTGITLTPAAGKVDAVSMADAILTGLAGHGLTVSPPSLEQLLREFHQAKAIHGRFMPEQPTVAVPDWIQGLRLRLLAEEVTELRDAVRIGSLEKIADGIADIITVVAGTAVVYGLPLDALIAEVNRSNMTKVNTPDEGKLVKGPGYEPPDIAGVLGLHSATDGAV